MQGHGGFVRGPRDWRLLRKGEPWQGVHSSEEGAHSSMHVALDRGRWGTGGGTQAKGQDLRAWDQEGGKWPNDVAMLIGGGGGCFFFPMGAWMWKLGS